jgi:hypothetical protein
MTEEAKKICYTKAKKVVSGRREVLRLGVKDILSSSSTLQHQTSNKRDPVEVNTIPFDIIPPIKNMKVTDKAFELPFVKSA